MAEFTTSNVNGIDVISSTPVPAASVNSLPLDWTKLGEQPCPEDIVRLPIDVVDEDEFDPEDDHISIIGTSGHKITKMGGLTGLKLKKLCLRSHLIHEMEGMETLTELTLLELYDNQISVLSQLDCMTNLTTLDISFNVIRDMAPVACLTNLTELYIANNKITQIKGLEGMGRLKTLDLGANRLRSMEGLSNLTSLESLWLGKNKITNIVGLETLKNVRKLDVQSNRLTSVEGLTGQVEKLEELYLASNGISDVGLAEPTTGVSLNFMKLSVMDLSKNKIESLSHFSHLTTLDELWFAENNVGTFKEVENLAPIKNLTCVYLEHNPISKDPEYRAKVKTALPSLTQIDANPVTNNPNSYIGGGVFGGQSVGSGPYGPAPPPAPEGTALREAQDAMKGFGMASMTDAQRVEVMRRLQQKAFERAQAQKKLAGTAGN